MPKNVKEIAKHRSGFLRNPFLYPSHGKVARKIRSRNLMREVDHEMVHYDRQRLGGTSDKAIDECRHLVIRLL